MRSWRLANLHHLFGISTLQRGGNLGLCFCYDLWFCLIPKSLLKTKGKRISSNWKRKRIPKVAGHQTRRRFTFSLSQLRLLMLMARGGVWYFVVVYATPRHVLLLATELQSVLASLSISLYTNQTSWEELLEVWAWLASSIDTADLHRPMLQSKRDNYNFGRFHRRWVGVFVNSLGLGTGWPFNGIGLGSFCPFEELILNNWVVRVDTASI